MLRGSLLLFFLTLELRAAVRPATPLIIEPEHDGQLVSAGDVHMVTAAFADADGDSHRCTDWEILGEDGPAWRADCVEGAEKIHIHMADGTFVGEYEGMRELHGGLFYRLRARHRDDSNDASSEWSEWSERVFLTGPKPPVDPMMLRDVLPARPARWMAGDMPIVVPDGLTLRIEQADGAAILDLTPGGPVDFAPLAGAAAIRIAIHVASGAELPASELTFDAEDGKGRTVYLPPFALEGGNSVDYWVSSNGSTHAADPSSRAPEFDQVRRGAPVPWRARRGFAVDVFASGFQLPVNIAFAHRTTTGDDEPLFYVAELYGDIKVVTRKGEVRTFATGLLDFDPTGFIPGSGESGVAGIVVDPENGDVYVTAVYWPDRSIRELYPRVLRLRPSADGLTAASIETVAAFPGERQSASHQISNVTIGPDRKLYVHVGDSAVHEYAQDMTTIRGKILRMNLDGTPANDNPFFDDTDGIGPRDFIWALGFRNPFGGAWRSADQSLYSIENGPATDRLAKIVRGRNYLWDGTDESMTNYAVATWTAPAAPVQLAFVESETFGGSAFPAVNQGAAFVTESGPTWGTAAQPIGKRITELTFDESDRVVRRETLVEYDGTGKATAAGIAAGPDGIYFTDLYKDWGYETPIDRGANVMRVRWVGFAAFAVSTNDLSAQFTDYSVVPDATNWFWDFGDGATSNERSPRHQYAEPGSYFVRLTVTGPRATVVETKQVIAGELLPRRRAVR